MDNTNPTQPTNPVPDGNGANPAPIVAPQPAATPAKPAPTPTFTYTADNGSSKGKIMMIIALLIVVCASVAGGAYFYMKSQNVPVQTVENTEPQNQKSIADIFSQLEQEVKAMESETLGIDTEFTEVDSDIKGL